MFAQDLPESTNNRLQRQFTQAATETPDGPTYLAQRQLLAEYETRQRREKTRAAAIPTRRDSHRQ